MAEPEVQVHRAADRFVTAGHGIDSRHSFSFGPHYDAANIAYGRLLAHNEDLIEPGAGYPTHPHRDLEIVTWVLRGTLEHGDSTGPTHLLRAGSVQLVSAGRGVLHSEHATADEPVHLVQMWVRPDESGLDPAYAQRDVEAELASGGLVPLASGRFRHARSTALRLATAAAALHAARVPAGGTLELPEAPQVHLFVARGAVALEGVGELSAGDAVRLTAAGARRLSARSTAEVLVWELHG